MILLGTFWGIPLWILLQTPVVSSFTYAFHLIVHVHTCLLACHLLVHLSLWSAIFMYVLYMLVVCYFQLRPLHACHLFFLHLCFLQASSAVVASMFVHADPTQACWKSMFCTSLLSAIFHPCSLHDCHMLFHINVPYKLVQLLFHLMLLHAL